MVISRQLLLGLCTGFLLLTLSACSTTPQRLVFNMPSSQPEAGKTPKVWPSPPNVPRYIYVGDLRGESNKHKDAKDKKGAMSRFFEALVGLNSDAIPLTDLLRPQHGAVDQRGRIYVADPGRNLSLIHI